MKKYGDTTLDFIPHGLKKNACICGERWSRQMPLELAAGYCGLAGAQALLRIPALRELIYQCEGKNYIDRVDLDNWITDLKEKYWAEKRGFQSVARKSTDKGNITLDNGKSNETKSKIH